MKFNHVGIPTAGSFDGEIPLPHLKMTVSDHQANPFGIQWQRYREDAPYPNLVKTVPHVAFEVDDLSAALNDQHVIIEPNRPGGRTGPRRPSRAHAGRLSRLPRGPRRPAAPAGPQSASRAAYDKAIELAGNTAETASLTRRRDQLG